MRPTPLTPREESETSHVLHASPVLPRLLSPPLGLLLQPLDARLGRPPRRVVPVRLDALLAVGRQLRLPVTLALLLLGDRVLLVLLVGFGGGVGWWGVLVLWGGGLGCGVGGWGQRVVRGMGRTIALLEVAEGGGGKGALGEGGGEGGAGEGLPEEEAGGGHVGCFGVVGVRGGVRYEWW